MWSPQFILIPSGFRLDTPLSCKNRGQCFTEFILPRTPYHYNPYPDSVLLARLLTTVLEEEELIDTASFSVRYLTEKDGNYHLISFKTRNINLRRSWYHPKHIPAHKNKSRTKMFFKIPCKTLVKYFTMST